MKTILELEGVQKLSKNQMKTVGGGGYFTGAQCNGIGYTTYINGQPDPSSAYESCTYGYQRTFLGMDWGGVQNPGGYEGPCPAGFMC
jgi:hypothetical protein